MSDVKMILVGDTNVGRPDPDSAFASVLPVLQDADIRFCNLETVLADARYLSPYDRVTLPRTDESVLASYVKAGFNVMNQANNPNTYHGLDALVRSLEVLDRAGIAHAGAGRNLAEARKPAIMERNGARVAFVCRTSVGTPEMAAGPDTPGVAYYPVHTHYEAPTRVHSNPGLPPIVHTVPDRGEHRAALQEDIRKAKGQADVVIMSWHWGLSPFQVHPGAGTGEVEVMDYQKEMGRFAIDAGADMVVGHHSHQPQPIEVYKGKPILYSLANFVHDLASFREMSFMAILVRCLIRDGKIHRLSIVPGKIAGNGPPTFGKPAQLPDVVRRMQEMSAPFGTKFQVGQDDVAVVL
ncbi:MAG: CapA family protein [Chloroflexi bacterium]|nr:CapA family protein [Chloroflexota bacterium]